MNTLGNPYSILFGSSNLKFRMKLYLQARKPVAGEQNTNIFVLALRSFAALVFYFKFFDVVYNYVTVKHIVSFIQDCTLNWFGGKCSALSGLYFSLH